MRWSAVLIAVGLVLLAFQVGFSDGAEPNIVGLPIGIWPLQAGMLALVGGLVAGLIGGTRRYRLAVICGLFGTLLAAFGLLFLYGRNPSAPPPVVTVNDVALILAAVLWAVAIVVGLGALRGAARVRRTREGHSRY